MAAGTGGGPIKVLIVDDAAAVRRSLREMLAVEPDIAVVGEAGDGASALQAARTLRPDVVLLDINLPDQDGLSVAAAIRRELPAQVVVISVEHSPEYFRRAMQVGACDYLVKPFAAADLVAAVRTAARGAAGAAPAAAQAPRGGGRQGHVVTVFGAKGGVGKTLLAVNLAVCLSLRPGERTVLVDLDLETGTVATCFHLRPRASLADLVRLPGPLDPAKVELALTRVPGYDLAVLAAPPWPHLAAEIEGQVTPPEGPSPGEVEGAVRVGEVISALARSFDWVVVDTASNFRDSNLVAFDHSQAVLLVTTPDIPALAHAGRCLELLCDRLGYPAERLRVVLNRRDPVAQVTPQEIADALGRPVDWELPHDAAAAVTSVNTGQPLCGRRSRSPLAEACGRLAAELAAQLLPAGAGGENGATPAARPARGRAGWLPWLRR